MASSVRPLESDERVAAVDTAVIDHAWALESDAKATVAKMSEVAAPGSTSSDETSRSSNFCPICLQDDSDEGGVPLIELACAHHICRPCAGKASAAGHKSCPTCRQPHVLDVDVLAQRWEGFRSDYASWRQGGGKGPEGEVGDVSLPRVGSKKDSLGLHSYSAGDLAELSAPPPPPGTPEPALPPKLKPFLAAATPQEPAVGFAIVGMGRAGKIHLGVLSSRTDAEVRWMVDVKPEYCPTSPGATVTADLQKALDDPAVDCVIVSTPTSEHAPVIRSALEAGKHVFAEKPLCSDPEEVPLLFDLAKQRNLLLHTAFNRRHDPAILKALEQVRSRVHGEVLGVSVVSRDYPYPLPSYLAISGNLFKDCVVHDLDYVTWLLDDEPLSLRAHASTSGDERACGMWEYSEVHLKMRSGATATLINGRVADSYDHRLDVYCERGVVRVTNPDEGATGVTFAQRFSASYHSQLAAFLDGVGAKRRGEEALPNVDLERTHFLERMIHACDFSAANGGVSMALRSGDDMGMEEVPAAVHAEGAAGGGAAQRPGAKDGSELRQYDDGTAERVKALYHTMRKNQSVEHVRAMRAKYTAPGKLGTVRMSMWDALDLLSTFVDVSDPDVTLPNDVHAFQTAEGLRAAGMPDWLQLTGLLHDLGKMIYLRGCDEDGTSVAQQWSIVGDTWVVGCRMPEEMVFPQFNADSPDARHPDRTTDLGIYSEGCGLDNVLCAYGHDEYMYEVLRQNDGVTLPKEALYVVRYHSLYPWHNSDCYSRLESDYDRSMKGWVKLFNQHDLYTKRDVHYSESELKVLREYYSGLAAKFLPPKLNW